MEQLRVTAMDFALKFDAAHGGVCSEESIIEFAARIADFLANGANPKADAPDAS